MGLKLGFCAEKNDICCGCFRKRRIIYGPIGGKQTGKWRKLGNTELHNFYSPPDIKMIISRTTI
jgi:hypothetical protein